MQSAREKEFIKILDKIASSYDVRTVFADFCRMAAISLRNRLPWDDETKRDALEAEFNSLQEKHKAHKDEFPELFALVVNELEETRTDFLGHVLERLNASNKGFGQFLTPECVATLMSKIVNPKTSSRKRLVTKVNDPCCGAGILLLEYAKEFVAEGGKQSELFIEASDLDDNAFNISYIQFFLLGYAAEVTRMDSLSLEVYEGPWVTIGYYLHDIEAKLKALRMVDVMHNIFVRPIKEDEPPKLLFGQKPKEGTSFEVSPSEEEVSVDKWVQQELF